jgi:hypothetical protein
MGKHECQLPAGLTKTRWRCPECWAVWTWNPKAGTGTDLWHGRDNVRTADGAKPRGGLWAWLTS